VVGIEVFSIDPLILYTGQTLTITMNYIPKASINGTYLALSNVYWKALIYTDRYYGYYNFPLYNGSMANSLEVKVLKMPIALSEGSYTLNMTFYMKGSDVFLGSALTPPFVVKSQPSGPGPVGTPMSKLPLTVVVRDSKGKYVEGVRVFVYDMMYNATVWSGKTDSWGTAVVTLSPGTYNVTIRYDNQTLSAIVNISTEPVTKEFTLPPVITIAPVTVVLDSYSILWLTLGLLGAVGAVVLERKGKTPLAVLLGLFTVGAILHSSLVMTKQVRPWFTVPELSSIFSTFQPKLPSLSLPDLTFLLQNLKVLVLVVGCAIIGLVGATVVVKGRAQPKRRIGRFAVPYGRGRRR